MNISSDPVVWVGAISALCVYSFLFKETIVTRLIEHVFIGMGAGYMLVMGFENLNNKAIQPVLKGTNMMMLLPIIIGLLLFTRFTPRYRVLGRYPIAILTGVGTALTMRGSLVADFVGQIRAAIVPITSVNALIVAAGTLGTVMYFFFTMPKNKVVSSGAAVGKWVMMVAFGAGFGNAAMGRISQLIGQLNLILSRWLGLYVR
jgi:hypothetical protein